MFLYVIWVPDESGIGGLLFENRIVREGKNRLIFYKCRLFNFLWPNVWHRRWA